jgi:tetratricopeptide (TPR) repeat protein
MSFVFRKFAKSRRKKDKVNPSNSQRGNVLRLSGIGPSSSSFSSSCQERSSVQKRNQVQQPLVPQRDDNDNDKTHPLNEQSPSHCSRTVTMMGAQQGPLHQASNGASTNAGPATTLLTTPSMDSTRRNRFKVMRRKPDLTPNTVASSLTSLSDKSFVSDASHQARASVVIVERGKQNQFSEIYAPPSQVARTFSFQEQLLRQQQENPPPVVIKHTSVDGTKGDWGPRPPPPQSLGGPPGEQSHSPELQSQEPVWGVPVHHEARHYYRRGTRSQSNSDHLDDWSNINNNNYSSHRMRTSKTVIMNGDIMVSASQSNATNETATTASTTSSKGRALRREAERIARAAGSLDTKGNELFEKGYFDKAMACYSKALKLKRRTFAHLLEEVDDMEAQLNLCDAQRVDPEILVSMATSINNIGYLRQRSGDATPDETMAAYNRSLHIKRRVLGNDSLSVGKTLNNIGSVHYLKREFDLAVPAYEEALQIMKINLGDKHTDIATVMSNIGDVFLAQGDPETSLQQYRQALIIRWENFGEKDPRVVRLLEKIAKVEIGDRMMTPKKAKSKEQQAWDDDEGSEVLDSALNPIAEEFQVLHEEVAKDIEHVTLMERRATVEMLKDKIVIIRGMRDIWEGNGPELLDNDTASVKTARSLASLGGYE